MISGPQIGRLSAAALLFVVLSPVLLQFEQEVLRDVVERYLDHGPDTVITVQEWAVVDDAIGAMRRQMRPTRAAA